MRPHAAVELALLALLYVGYSAARLLADDDRTGAVAHAHRLLDLEAALHLDVEAWANHLLAGVPGLALVASYWYSALHYLVTPAVLVWVYRRHALGYRRVAQRAGRWPPGSAWSASCCCRWLRRGCCPGTSTCSPPRRRTGGGAATRARPRAWAG